MRVAMLSLRNLLANNRLELGPDMVEAGLPKVVQQRITQVGTNGCRYCLCKHLDALSALICKGLGATVRRLYRAVPLCVSSVITTSQMQDVCSV